MTKKQIIIGVVVLVVVLLAIFLFNPSKESNGVLNATSTATTTQSTSQAPAVKTTVSSDGKSVVTSKAVVNQVLIYRTSYYPTSLNIVKGSKVTWVNKDTVTHKIVSDNLGPTSADLLPGQSYSYTFKTAGIYGYHDSVNSTTTGTIVVK